ncbi:MAG: 7-cyano-7-deazaguanine synthase QueC [Planctomycetota bacterium]
MNDKRPAIVLLSGGLDSTTTLAIAQDEGFEVHAITFRYGQRHEHEIEKAKSIAAAAGVASHVIADIDLKTFGGSALTAEIDVPKGESVEDIGDDIPVTYVPARNTIFLSFALALAEVRDATDIFIGVNALDYSGYPDCRPEFISAFQDMANLATKAAVQGEKITIHTPLIDLTKAKTIEWGLRLGVDYSMTTSCYDPTPAGESCGQCDSCLLRKRGFEENGIDDPIAYA